MASFLTNDLAPAHTARARLHESGFALSDSNFYSLSRASDGCIYYTLCSHDIDTHGQVYRHDPQRDIVEHLGDLGEIVGEAGTGTIPQGKSHSPFYEHAGSLYFSTHYGFYSPSSDREAPGEVPEGYKPYPGGHFIRYDMAARRFHALAQARAGEGMVAFHMDGQRGRLYGLTWPHAHFISYDLNSDTLRDHGPVSRGGELGRGDQYFCICRCFGIDPRNGNVYWTNADGQILRYQIDGDAIGPLQHATLKRDILGNWDTQKPGHQGYNWRHLFWYEPWQKFIGVHPKSGYLFQFDPATEQLDLIDRICAEPLRRSGRFEPFRYGYLTLELGPDGETIYYITGGPAVVAEDGRRIEPTLHLVTYHLGSGRYRDHGVLRLEDGRYPTLTQSLAVHPNGRLYTAPWIEKPTGTDREKVNEQCDLISFANPLAAPEQALTRKGSP
ncbi:MAG: hypothetical protein WD118_01645 [Phycisphaeraceae bacterium]